MSWSFDTTGKEAARESDFGPLPAGTYLVDVVTKPEVNKEGKVRVPYECTVLEGQFAKRKIFGGFARAFPEPVTDGQHTALKISEKLITSWVLACGKVGFESPEELHGIPVLAVVRVKPASGQYDASNEVTAFKSASDAPKEEAPPKAPASGEKKAAPWGKKSA